MDLGNTLPGRIRFNEFKIDERDYINNTHQSREIKFR